MPKVTFQMVIIISFIGQKNIRSVAWNYIEG